MWICFFLTSTNNGSRWRGALSPKVVVFLNVPPFRAWRSRLFRRCWMRLLQPWQGDLKNQGVLCDWCGVRQTCACRRAGNYNTFQKMSSSPFDVCVSPAGLSEEKPSGTEKKVAGGMKDVCHSYMWKCNAAYSSTSVFFWIKTLDKAVTSLLCVLMKNPHCEDYP